MSSKHILVLGSGSVGKRHARNLSSLGCDISCFDPREDRIKELAEETPVKAASTDLNEAFSIRGLDGVVVASPTAFHPKQTIRALESGLPVLLEKPSAKTLAETQAMLTAVAKAGVPVLLGYTWRWWPPLSRVRELLDSGRIGRILHVQFHMSAHLADWHPWEPYQEFFMASTEQGGGALLDESHWIDLMLCYFGKPESVYGQVEKISDLEIETDDNVDIIAKYSDGKRVTIHLDLYGRPHEKFIRFVGNKGTILWTVNPNRISVCTDAEHNWEHENFVCDRNEMFTNVAEDFLAVIGGITGGICNLRDGALVSEIVEAVRLSCYEEKLVWL